MKVAIGARPRSGPWGGGNQFVVALTKFLEDRGVDVRYGLDESDLDLILLTEPRRSSASCAFNDIDIISYLRAVNPRALVVHRVNECDERKKTSTINRRLEVANLCADRTVFISTWLRDLLSRQRRFKTPVVIRNGADRAVFRPAGPRWNEHEPLRVVTHHWSDNWMKGFDVYRRLDRLLQNATYAVGFRFTYIGRVPPGLNFMHTRVESPQHGQHLASLLREHHVYLTASQNEPAGMHHIEGALSGLPVLYRLSGALPEYCEGFGLGFDDHTFEKQLWAMRELYGTLKPQMPAYPHDAERMCSGYLRLFGELVENRDAIVAERRRSIRDALTIRTYSAIYDRYYAWRQ